MSIVTTNKRTFSVFGFYSHHVSELKPLCTLSCLFIGLAAVRTIQEFNDVEYCQKSKITIFQHRMKNENKLSVFITFSVCLQTP